MNASHPETLGQHPPIAAVGMACLFPDAPGLREYWRLIRRGEDAIREIPETHFPIDDYFSDDPKSPDRIYCRRGGFLEPTTFDPLEYGIPPAVLEATDTAQLLGLVVGKRALEDAGYGATVEFDRTRASVILGVTGTQELVIPLGARLGHPRWRRALENAGVAADVAAKVMQEVSDSYVGWQENSFPGLLGNVVAGRIANRLNLKGTNCVVDAACASSLSALHLAILELVAGRSDMVLTGGVDTLNDIFMFMCFSKTQALSNSGDARPFSAEADGTVIGEGVGMLVLKRLADAERDNDRIYAVIRGVGSASDGRAQSIYAPLASGQAIALRNAYKLSGVNPATVELVEAHGTGTKVGDAVEFSALNEVFREANPEGQWCAVGSVKSQIGHTKAAAGAASLIKSVLALHHKVLPATLKIDTPHPKLDIENSPFYLATEARPWLASPDHPRRAAVSSFGFGGSNFHTVLEEYGPPTTEPAWDGAVQIFALSGDSPDALRGELDELTATATSPKFTSDALARAAHASRTTFRGDAPYRLAMVFERGDDFTTLLGSARKQLESRPLDASWFAGNVFFGGPSDPGEIAFLFPGQGSQYCGMCRDVVCVFPEAREAVEAASAAVAVDGATLGERIFPRSTFDESRKAANEAALTATDVAQPALGAVSVALLRVLERFGVRPHFVAGHSYGELVALHAAGCLDAHGLQELSALRGRIMAEAAAECDGAMLAVHAPLEDVDKVIADHGFDVVVANRNAPSQAILSGPRAVIEQVATVLEETRGWRTRLLKVSAAFHSRLMHEASTRFRAALEHIHFEPPNIPVFANASGQPYPLDVAGVRSLLSDQLARPVMFVDEIRHMYDQGVRTFVEIGPKNVLTGLVGNILSGKAVQAIAADALGTRGGSGMADIARVLALLAILGHAVDLAAWEAAPPPAYSPQMSVALLGANYRSTGKPAGRKTDDLFVDPSATQTSKGPMHAPHSERFGASTTRPTDPHTNGAGNGSAAPAHGHAPPTINGHPAHSAVPPAAPPTAAAAGDLNPAFALLHEALRSLTTIQQHAAQSHQRFLDSQDRASAALHALVDGHQRLIAQLLNVPGGLASLPAASPSSPIAPPPSAAMPPQIVPPIAATMPVAPSQDVTPPVPIAPAAHAPASSHILVPHSAPRPATPNHASTVTPEHAPLAQSLLHAVSEVTGYPLDSLTLDMDLELDLGIDRVRKVDLLARTAGLPAHVHQHGDRLRTLRDILTLSNGHATNGDVHTNGDAHLHANGNGHVAKADAAPVEVAQPDAAPSGEADAIGPVLVEVVAELTGYPAEMLGLEMDLEADLGIDSIKRLEILSAVQRRLPDLPTVDSQYLGSLRTLQNIVEYLEQAGQPLGKADGGAVAAAATPETLAPAASQTTLTGWSIAARALRRVTTESATSKASPAAGDGPVFADGVVWLAADENDEFADALAASLAKRGVDVMRVALTLEPPTPPERLAGLLLVPPICRAASIADADMLKSAFALTQRGAKALQATADARLVAIERLDGAFGLRDAAAIDVHHGALAGLVKTADDEWPAVGCHTIDSDPALDVDRAAELAVGALVERDASREIGIAADGGRVELTLDNLAAPSGDLPLSAGDVVVVTGGARGVTAACGIELARSAGVTLILLGRSTPPPAQPDELESIADDAALKRALLARFTAAGEKPTPVALQRAVDAISAQREIRATLAAIRAAGGDAEYHAVDVRDATAVRALLAEIQSRRGPVRGVVHGAGVLADAKIEDKTPDAIRRVLDTKLTGLASVLAALDPGELRVLALFSSVSARFGRRGQADYAMANEVLNKFAQRFAAEHPTCRAVALNWGPWEGGMVTPPLAREFQRLGLTLIPLAAGAQAFVQALRSDVRDVEIVLGDGFGPPTPQIIRRELALSSHGFLNGHRIRGRAVLPVAMMLEWFAEAARRVSPDAHLRRIDGFRVLRGVLLDDGEAIRLEIRPGESQDRGGERHQAIELVSIASDGTESPRARATLVFGPDTVAASAAGAHCSAADVSQPYPATLAKIYGELLFHDAPLRVIEAVDGYGPRAISAIIIAADSPDSWMTAPLNSTWRLDPAVVDGCLQLGLLWTRAALGGLSIPLAVESLTTVRAPRVGERLSALVTIREQDRQRALADALVRDQAGEPVLMLRGIELIVDAKLNDDPRSALPAPHSSAPTRKPTPHGRRRGNAAGSAR